MFFFPLFRAASLRLLKKLRCNSKRATFFFVRFLFNYCRMFCSSLQEGPFYFSEFSSKITGSLTLGTLVSEANSDLSLSNLTASHPMNVDNARNTSL